MSLTLPCTSTAAVLPFMGKNHPLTGEPIRAIGFRADGRPIFPIMGGDPSNDPPERPDDVPEDEWDALGDPGKKALVRERGKVSDLERQLAAARAKPAPPKPPAVPAVLAVPVKPDGDQPDFAALIKEAVDAAVRPFAEKDQQREAQDAANRIRTAVIDAAKDRLHDGSDGLMIDLAAVVAEDGTPDDEKIAKALDKLIETKPHLAKDTRRFAGPGVGPTAGGAAVPMKEQVQNLLGEMQRVSGVRTPTS